MRLVEDLKPQASIWCVILKPHSSDQNQSVSNALFYVFQTFSFWKFNSTTFSRCSHPQWQKCFSIAYETVVINRWRACNLERYLLLKKVFPIQQQTSDMIHLIQVKCNQASIINNNNKKNIYINHFFKFWISFKSYKNQVLLKIIVTG